MKKMLLFPLLLVILLLAAGPAFSQEEDRGVAVGLGGEIGGGVFLIIPEIAGYVTVPIDFSGLVTLTPKVGFSYLFNIMEETHTNLYIPIGVDLLFNRYHFGFSLQYFFAIQNITGEHLLLAVLSGYLPIIRTETISFFFQFEFGPAFHIRPGIGLQVFTRIHPALGFQYYF